MSQQIDNCALYFPVGKIDLKAIFPHGRSDGGLLRKATWFEFDSPEGPVRLSLGHPNLPEHLRGFSGFVMNVSSVGPARAKALSLLANTRYCVGVSLPASVSPESDAFTRLVDLIRCYDGFMFVHDSIMLPDRSYLVGLMTQGEEEEEVGYTEPATRAVDPANCRHAGATDGVPPERVAMREEHYRQLAERGFRSTRSLPLLRDKSKPVQLRPLEEIASRLLALRALFAWVTATEEHVSGEKVQKMVAERGLREHLTADEQEILDMPREEAREEHIGMIGWRLENMWPLAWIFGFDEVPTFYAGQFAGEEVGRMFEYLPAFGGSPAELVSLRRARSAAEVDRLEDLFYCAHNAVRSAQLGHDTVPAGFHPMREGGVVHERRHALTWALSPGVEWEDADLST